MNLYHLVTWIAIPLLGLGSVAVFITFLVQFFKHQSSQSQNHPPSSDDPQ